MPVKKKRTSIIVEQVYMDAIITLINKSGASGFTVYENIYGSGKHGKKETFGSLKEFSGNVEIVTISSQEVCEALFIGLQSMIDKGIHLIVHSSDVTVIRDQHFS